MTLPASTTPAGAMEAKRADRDRPFIVGFRPPWNVSALTILTCSKLNGRVTQARCEAITLILVSSQDKCLGIVPAYAP